MDLISPADSCAIAASATLHQLLPDERGQLEHFDNEEKVQDLVSSLHLLGQFASLGALEGRLNKVIRLSKLMGDLFASLAPSDKSLQRTMWGLFGLVIKFISRNTDYMDSIVRTFEELLNVIPRESSYLEFVSRNADLQLAVSDVYKEYMDLALRTVKTFGRGRINIVTKLKWKRDQKGFQHNLRRLKRLKEQLALEVGLAHQELNNQQLQQISAAVSNFALEQTASNKTLQDRVSFIVSFPQNLSFYGRESHLLRIHEELDPSKKRPGGGLNFVALCGLGGTGKTQIALEYFYKFRSSYTACFWVTCDTPVKSSQGYGEIARRLKLCDSGHPQILTEVKTWLCESRENWLLVFDDAGHPQDLSELWPPASQGSILLTSQNQNWLIQESLSYGTLVDSFSLTEGVEMLETMMTKQGRNVPHSTAESIVEELGGLPLAIRQIGSYILATSLEPADLLQRYQLDRATASAIEEWDEGLPLSYRHTLANVWKFAFDRLSEAAILLLNILSFLDPDAIPQELFNEDESMQGLPSILDSRVKSQYALQDLRRYSLVTSSSTNNGRPALSIHRQVRKYVLNHLAQETLRKASSWALQLLRKKFPHQSPFAEPLSHLWPQCEQWIAHVISLNVAIGQFKDLSVLPKDLPELFTDASIYLWERGLLEQGRELILSAKALVEAQESDLLLKDNVFSFYGCILSELGDLDQAFFYFSEHAHHRKENLLYLQRLGKQATMLDEIRLANAYNNVAGILCAQGRYQEAELNNTLSLKIKERWTAECDLRYLLSLSFSNLANVFGRQEKWDQAAQYYEKAIDIGKESNDTTRRALTYHNFGCMRLEQHQVIAARDLLTEAFQLRSEALGDHNDTATTLHMLALCHYRLGDIINARDLLQEAVRILEKNPQEQNRRRIARSKYKLSHVLRELHDPRSEEFLSDARRLRAEVMSADEARGLENEATFDALVAYI